MQLKKGAMLVAVFIALGTGGLQQTRASEVNSQAEASPQAQIPGAFHHRQLDPAYQAKLEKFLTDTQALRKQIAIKSAEERARIHAQKPDIAAVNKAAGELFDMRAALADQAREAGVFARPRNEDKQGGKAQKFAMNQAKAEKFFTETRALRRQIAIASAGQKALLRSAEADPQQVAKSAGTLFELRENLRQKAREAGLASHYWSRHANGHHHDRLPWMLM